MALNPDSMALPGARSPFQAPDPETLHARWRRTHGRLADALLGYRSLRGHARPGDPAWIAAQLRVAEARRRCHELTEELDALTA
jgi:hypothetical protein